MWQSQEMLNNSHGQSSGHINIENSEQQSEFSMFVAFEHLADIRTAYQQTILTVAKYHRQPLVTIG